MERKYFKKEKPFENYSYSKSRIKNNQQTNILKTYNNINNEIIINIKNNDKCGTETDKKYEVRRIHLKLPDELINKKDGLDFLNFNLRNSNNSTHSIPNSLIYKQNLEKQKFKLEQLINEFSIRNKLYSTGNINNTFQYTENNINNNDNDNDNYNDKLSQRSDKKENQNPINKINVNYYKKPFHTQKKIVYHKINHLSLINKKEIVNCLNTNKNSNQTGNKKKILEIIRKPKIYKYNPITNLSLKNTQEKNSNKNIIEKLNPKKIIKKEYKKIYPKEVNEDLRENRLPINVNRNRRFLSNNLSQVKDNESNNNIINKAKNSFDRKTFRFLINQTNKNNDLSTSFSKYYHSCSKKRHLLKSSQLLSLNDSLSCTNTYNETESNNESTNTNNTKLRNTTNNVNPILINDETDSVKNCNKKIRNKKYLLTALNSPKIHFINHTSKSRVNSNIHLLTLTDLSKNLISQPRNISAISLSGINLELYYIEEKMKLVIDKIRNYEKCSKECYNYLKYFFEKNFYQELLRPIKDEENIEKMSNYIKLEISCYFLCYYISLGENFKITEILLKSIFDILFNNFILYLSLIISQCEKRTDNIIIVLKKIIKDNMNSNNQNFEIDENKFIDTITNNSKSIFDYYNIIINNIYNQIETNSVIKFPEYIYNILTPNNNIEINEEQCEKIIPLFFREVNKSLNELNIDFFQKFFDTILCFNNKSNNNNKEPNNNIEYDILDNNKTKNKKYFLPEIKSDKEYSLILDLEDTLIHSKRDFNFRKKINLCNINKKIIILRPYLLEFLQEMKSLFELILFSSNTPEYVDPILNIIQKDKKYFDFVLYRHHITLDDEGNNVKNLELLGRDLKKVIIIDDIPRYFKLQKENGINIKPFYGNVNNDGNTLKCLGEILKKIREDAVNNGDIRISLDKFREELYPNIVDKLEMN